MLVAWYKFINFGVEKSPVLVFACKRAHYLEKTLKTLFERMPHNSEPTRERFEIWVSQDGTNAQVHDLVKNHYPQVRYLQHVDPSPLKKDHPGDAESYYLIARHYQWAMSQVFAQEPDAKHLIVLEEDIEVAMDFFEYMEAGAALMRK
ncbi:glycosyl transferase, partial [Baffinella frigidus]